ncbi:MAG: DUF898 family protein [Demequinaceae bacterium]|nr:DUF898 family protein [Demequinaceae bacterium]
MAQGIGRFEFKEDVAGFAVNAIAAYLITAVTLGLGAPIGIVLLAQWFAKNATLDGLPLEFTGNAGDLFGKWIGWWLLTIITLGIYAFWMYPKVIKWVVQNMATA